MKQCGRGPRIKLSLFSACKAAVSHVSIRKAREDIGKQSRRAPAASSVYITGFSIAAHNTDIILKYTLLDIWWPDGPAACRGNNAPSPPPLPLPRGTNLSLGDISYPPALNINVGRKSSGPRVY